MDNMAGSIFSESEKAVTGFMADCLHIGQLGKLSESREGFRALHYGKPYTTAKGVRSFPRKTLG